ncbi:Homogentisate-dioxygenase [Mycena venus]|uniref:homogentisate 1,2-dioxygenase n=1 Tax=Mycena venus TaxID=2733690 RepID=A0A8H6U318_9AGAR|nr:Homogentisate-dioxygenase [Mycena venus]
MMQNVLGATARSTYATTPTETDPYVYQVGFGNRFASEAIPGVLPAGQNCPQKVKYGLYIEGITGSALVATRAESQTAWFYRIRPSVAHQGFMKLARNPDLESNFLPSNPNVHLSPTQLAWNPFDTPSASDKVDFVDELKTLAGNGDPTLREGLGIHVYVANTSMDKRALCNSDGDMLILPQLGSLDVQTEFGRMMVRPGELLVVQRGIKFKVNLPDGPSRGYIQEIFGSHCELPDHGPIGGHGLANPRDFESPIASFDLDQTPWQITYKYAQSPIEYLTVIQHKIDWEANCFPALKSTPHSTSLHGTESACLPHLNIFVQPRTCISKDHMDASIFCVLTSKSKAPGVPLADFLIFSPRWDVSTNTFRPPHLQYYHRNAATEFMGLIYGVYGGRSDGFQPGSASYETGFCPHGVSYEEYKKATEVELKPIRIHEGTLAFMFESSMMLTITDFAMARSGKLHEHEPKMWNDLKAEFMNHLDEASFDLRVAGLPSLSERSSIESTHTHPFPSTVTEITMLIGIQESLFIFCTSLDVVTLINI